MKLERSSCGTRCSSCSYIKGESTIWYVNDSKKLTEKRLLALEEIKEALAIGIGISSVEDIDQSIFMSNYKRVICS